MTVLPFNFSSSLHQTHVFQPFFFKIITPLGEMFSRQYFPNHHLLFQMFIPQIYCVSIYILCVHMCFTYQKTNNSMPLQGSFSWLGSDIAPLENVHLCPKDQVASSKNGAGWWWGVSLSTHKSYQGNDQYFYFTQSSSNTSANLWVNKLCEQNLFL